MGAGGGRREKRRGSVNDVKKPLENRGVLLRKYGGHVGQTMVERYKRERNGISTAKAGKKRRRISKKENLWTKQMKILNYKFSF